MNKTYAQNYNRICISFFLVLCALFNNFDENTMHVIVLYCDKEQFLIIMNLYLVTLVIIIFKI